MATKQDKKIRLTLDLSPEFYNRLLELEELSGAETKARLLRDALQVYEYIVTKTVEGCSFRVIRKDGTPEHVVFVGPPLSRTL